MSRMNVEGARLIGNVLAEGHKYLTTKQTLAGTYTIAADDNQLLFFDPDGDRTIVLPAEADGLFFTIVNTASADEEILTVMDDSSTDIIGYVDRGMSVTFVCDGTTWYSSAEGTGVSAANFEALTGAKVLTAADNGKRLLLNATTGFEVTLPAVAEGLNFQMIGGPLEVTGSNHTIISNAADVNGMFGAVSAGGIVVLIDTHDLLTLVADKFLAGDVLDFFCDGTNWYVSGIMGVTVGITSA